MSNQHHLAGTAFIENQAVGVSPAFEPTVNSGRGVELGATNDLAFEVPAGHLITIYDIVEGRHIQFDSDGVEVVL